MYEDQDEHSTENRVLVPLSKEVAEAIDENRDDLSRWKFIELCINEFFERVEEQEKEESEKKSAVKDRVLVPLSQELVTLIDKNRGELSRWRYIEFCVNKYSERKEIILYTESPENEEETENKEESPEIPWKRTFDWLWLGAVLSYGIGDVVSSYLAFGNAPVAEENPVLKYLFGGNIYALIPFKIVIILSLFLVSYYYLPNKFASLFIPSMLTCIGILISITNLLYYID